ncbi:HIT domain-containing protein [Candidatus Parcubacteria bacterium]|nr:HIT domain-containing protein [Candidatus Parcubacteria bacterium]
MTDPNCIFCKIANKEIPANIVHENEHTIAFLDIHPKAEGHTLLIPKEHHRWFIDMPDDLSDELFRTAKQVSKMLKNEHKADFVRLGIVGVDVPHVHIHLIPQKMADNGPEI